MQEEKNVRERIFLFFISNEKGKKKRMFCVFFSPKKGTHSFRMNRQISLFQYLSLSLFVCNESDKILIKINIKCIIFTCN